MKSQSKKALTATENSFLHLYGAKGIGKTYTLINLLKELNLTYIDIDLSINSLIPFGSLIFNLKITPSENHISDIFYEEINNLIQTKTVLIFSNFEYCDADSMVLIQSLINYYTENSEHKEIKIILEENTESKPTSIEGTALIELNKLSYEDVLVIVKQEILANNQILNWIVELSEGNIHKLRIIYNLLIKTYNVTRSKDKLNLNSLKNIPGNTIMKIYLDLFDKTHDILKNTLKIVASIGGDFYDELLCKANINISTNTLKEISEYRTFIEPVFSEGRNTSYRFISPEIKDYILTDKCTDNDELNNILRRYYLYLTSLANDISFDERSYYERIIILHSIINLRVTSEQYCLDYYHHLMKTYYSNFAFESMVVLHRYRSKCHFGNDNNIFNDFPDYRAMMLQAFNFTSRYKETISLGYTENHNNEIFLVAKAYYLNGDPQRALKLLETYDDSTCFNTLNLKASIYNWFSDIERSRKYIEKALLFAEKSKEEDKKHFIFKKGNLGYFNVPDKQIERTISFFRQRPKRELAEVLFNYGTEKLLAKEREEVKDGLNKIKEAQILFHQTCDTAIWHCIHSYGIHDVLEKRFEKGIEKWESIIESSKCACFSELTVYLNITCAYIKLNKLSKAKLYLDKVNYRILEYNNISLKKKYAHIDLIEDYKVIVKQNPDISLCVRNYLLMQALIAKRENRPTVKMLAKKALKASKYNSTSQYLLERLANGEARHRGTNYIKKLFSEEEMYFCSILFWNN